MKFSLVYNVKLEAGQFIDWSNLVILFLFFDVLKPANFLTLKAFDVPVILPNIH